MNHNYICVNSNSEAILCTNFCFFNPHDENCVKLNYRCLIETVDDAAIRGQRGSMISDPSKRSWLMIFKTEQEK